MLHIPFDISLATMLTLATLKKTGLMQGREPGASPGCRFECRAFVCTEFNVHRDELKRSAWKPGEPKYAEFPGEERNHAGI
jgi:hypothetical protein